jgi:AcrR family transcriptional regulator
MRKDPAILPVEWGQFERAAVVRPYRLGKRAIGVAATRQRIMDATQELLENGGFGDANIQAIAKRAGVTRPTVYQQFGSHRELLLAVLNDALDRADVRTIRKALQHPDAAKAVRGMIRGSCRFWDSGSLLFGRIKGLALMDEAVAHVDQLKEEVRRGHIDNITGRLSNEGLLRTGLSRKEAADRLYLLTSFEVFERMKALGHSTDAVASRLIDLAEETVLA